MPTKTQWGWVVAITGMFIPSLYAAAQRCFSVFYASLMGEFAVNYGAVSWLNGLYLGGYGLGSLAVPTMYQHISYRMGVMVAGVVSCLTVFLSSFLPSLWSINFTAGFVPGLCTAVTTVGIYGSVKNYFVKRRNTGMQLLCTGASVGAFIYCPVYQLLIDTYSWRGALQFISGFYLHIVVVGSLLRPVDDFSQPATRSCVHLQDPIDEAFTRKSSNDDLRHSSTCCSATRKIYNDSGLAVVLKLKFQLFTWSWIAFAAAYYSSLTFLVPYGKTNFDISDVQATTLVSAVSFGEIGSRLLFATFFDRFDVSRRMTIAGLIHLILACIFFSVPFITNYILLLVLCALIGVGGGGMDAVYAVFTTEILGPDLFAAVYSYSSVLSFIAGSATTVLFGTAIDAIGDTKVVFYFGAASLVISFLMMLVESRLCRSLTVKCDSKT